MTDERERIILSGRAFAYRRSTEWYGNWCWNAYWLTIDEAARFLIWLQSTRRWHCTSSWSEFYEAFNAETPLDKIAVGAWLAQAAAQERA